MQACKLAFGNRKTLWSALPSFEAQNLTSSQGHATPVEHPHWLPPAFHPLQLPSPIWSCPFSCQACCTAPSSWAVIERLHSSLPAKMGGIMAVSLIKPYMRLAQAASISNPGLDTISSEESGSPSNAYPAMLAFLPLRALSPFWSSCLLCFSRFSAAGYLPD